MCQDIPGQPIRKRIAVCSCGQDFPDCDVQDALVHASHTTAMLVHRWVWVDPSVEELDVLMVHKK